ncbi:right-handed parallel beta-helix repeat-containing protein [Psychrosphaera sp. F3M07]|uniref:parallel beta-helix domain-containing protein n=2 Tax=Psychrosphaera TaxID=907197 RepID=UPI001C0A2D9D|nr:parallel beta-helix domain-containing protein [Psychrosphaera sp. F3M07]MBU2918615.1 right-handed parallel beta-helix repeat-containing protein [Psychrosphaera sp. F3M07]
MENKTMLRSLLAIAVATSITACGDKAEDIAELVEDQTAIVEQIEQQQEEQEATYTGSGGTDPIPPTLDAPSTTEALTIPVPGGKDAEGNYLAYPWNAEGTTQFWYGLDEHEVVIPEASDNVIHLTFSGEFDPVDGTEGPAAELDIALRDKTGDLTVVLPEGTFKMNQALRVDLAGDAFSGITSLTVQGHGINKTILSYTESSNDVSDSVNFSVAEDLELAHFTVVDSNKNAILVDESNGVYIHHVAAIWPGKPDAGNGAYGLYPVESDNVIIEDSFSFGSADAGIYVGQTNNIVVRRNYAVQNVAGIEIENSKDADVYDNYAYMNTGGILVFDLPIANGRFGVGTRVFNNVSVSNNEENFAAHGVVGLVPPGTGMLLLASDTVEVFDNDFSGNETFSVVGVSHFLVNIDVTDYIGNPATGAPGAYSSIIANGWRPTLRAINIHNNRITNSGTNPRGALLEAPLTDGAPGVLEAYLGTSGYVPAVLTDGMGQNLAANNILASIGEMPYEESDYFCVDPAQNASTGTVIEHTGATSVIDTSTFELNLAAASFEVDHDGSYLFKCDEPLERLPAYSATFRGVEFGCGKDDNGDICTNAMPPQS